jgi:hypothetical protein
MQVFTLHWIYYSILNKIKTMSMEYIKLEDQFIELEGSVSSFFFF